MTQLILVIVLFIIASLLIGKKLYDAFSGKGEDCESCAVGKSLNHKKGSKITTSSDS